MEKKKKMSTTQVIIPKTDFVLGGILENLAKDFSLAIQDNPANYELSLNMDRVANGPDFRLGYQRHQMDDEVEEEGLYLDRNSIEANFSTEDGKIDLIYRVNKSELKSNMEVLGHISKEQDDLAGRLANPATTSKRWVSLWTEIPQLYPRTQKRISKIIEVTTTEEIQPFLKALIRYNK